MTDTTALVVTQAAATLALAGIAWFVQLVFYPSYVHVGRDTFQRFEASALGRVVWVVAPLMLIEAGTTTALLLAPSAAILSGPLTGVGSVSVVTAWISTFAIQWPLHRRLARAGWDPDTVRWLVRSQWIRTVAWTVHSGTTLATLANLIR